MRIIDGARGEGGGQVLRTALTASLLHGEPIRIRDIRANRSKPGLLPSHLAAVRAAVEISGGRVKGAELRSTEVEFAPGPLRPGSYRFDIGSAGSTTLLFQTILLPMLQADGEFELVFIGGTHNPKAPPFDFLDRTYVPLLSKLGADVEVELLRPGFAPKGGGAFRARVRGGTLKGEICLEDRGEVRATRVRALLSKLPEHIAEREVDRVRTRLSPAPTEVRVETIANAAGPGNVFMIELETDVLTEVFTSFGRRHTSPEHIADEAWAESVFYLESQAVVGPHLADQLVPILALLGRGSFFTVYPTLHTRTQVDLVNELMDTPLRVEEVNAKTWRIGWPAAVALTRAAG